MVSSTPRPHFTPQERPGTHFTGGWVGPRACLEGQKISSSPGFDPGPSSPQSVAIPTELPGPHTAVCNRTKCRLHFVKWSGSDTKQQNMQPAVSQQKRVVDGKQTECCQRKGGDGIRQLNKNLLRNTVTGCCEYDNELSDPTKGDYQFHVKDSDPRSEVEERTQAASFHVSLNLEQCF